ncbi:hypothetical protein [Nonomuraea roseola]|uniref:Uncharacterized protein n=1 Tax=Nonomuraea roseola TaxID=46179 RepID=A0ABV5PTD0_9ACTN
MSVTLCELLIPLPEQGGPRPAPTPGEARKLTTHVAEMVAAINALPSDERSFAGAVRMCTTIGYGEELSFSVAYREGPPAVVLLDVNHSPCVRDGLPARVDVVWAADVTGAVAETRVWRGRCEAVFAGTVLGVVAERPLLSRLDAWLGG